MAGRHLVRYKSENADRHRTARMANVCNGSVVYWFRKFVPDHLYDFEPRVLEALTPRHSDSHALNDASPSSSQPGLQQNLVRNSKQQQGRTFGSRGVGSRFMIPSFSEPLGFGKIELYSPKYFLTCALGGMLCCGITHCGMTPVDVVKCNMQIDPKKYKTISGGFRTAIAEQGIVNGLLRGWAPTFLGYSIQGAGKYGFYEFFKHYYSEAVGAENAAKYKTLLYLSASASAEFLADIGLSPFEAVKVRLQTQPGFAKGLSDGLPKILAAEGVRGGLYKGIVPLWARQIPYTMMKFATFEKTVEALYEHVVRVPKEKCSPGAQLGVSFAAGYIAGVACAVISHPADNLVSYLNNAQGATVAKAFKEMGTKALLTRGLPLRIFMIGTLTAAQWCIYDAFKVFVGLPTTGGPPPVLRDSKPDSVPKNT
ncbi:hypothetical protein R1sor_026124 [Riccia sorocarpa]|uniref:Mitochondrial phosphate carrier protein n=1 Tax=Riccia sorocarpa TaxID=122646 RepID=A0ABD3GBY5_9MARC